MSRHSQTQFQEDGLDKRLDELLTERLELIAERDGAVFLKDAAESRMKKLDMQLNRYRTALETIKRTTKSGGAEAIARKALDG